MCVSVCLCVCACTYACVNLCVRARVFACLSSIEIVYLLFYLLLKNAQTNCLNTRTHVHKYEEIRMCTSTNREHARTCTHKLNIQYRRIRLITHADLYRNENGLRVLNLRMQVRTHASTHTQASTHAAEREHTHAQDDDGLAVVCSNTDSFLC